MTRVLPRLVMILCALVFANTLVAIPAPAAEVEGPAFWANVCQKKASGLALAEVVSEDKDNNGAPVKLRPDVRGKYVPIVYIHGWTSSSIHTSKGPPDERGAFSVKPDLLTSRIGTATPARTLIGNIQDLGGTAPFTFDYSASASRWVTDKTIGPELKEALTCLYEESGEKVIVVAHSMGGLATRKALQLGGPELTSKVSQVITFGTPNTGSIGAKVVALGVDGAALAYGPALLFRLWLSYCGRVKTDDQNKPGLLCWNFLPHQLTSFGSEAGVALRSGSKELDALAPWPAGLPVHSLAGASEFTVVGQGFFKQRVRAETGAGDLIVTLKSAQTGATTKEAVPCAYELEAATNVVNNTRVDWLKIATKNEVNRPWVDLLTTPIPCFHSNLMRNADLALKQLTLIADDLAQRVPPTELRTIRPWSDGTASNPDQVIQGSAAITCGASDYVIRSDAYQCRSDGAGWWDPCLKSPSATSYVCVVDQGTVLIEGVPPERNPLDNSPEESNPFRVELGDGTVCWRRQGAGPSAIPGYGYWLGVCNGPRAGIWRERGDDRLTRDESVRGLYDQTDTGVWHIAIEENAAPGQATLYPAKTVYR